MGRQSDDVQLLALALLSMADDEGYFRAEPSIVRGEVMPFREDLARIRECLATLSRIEWIEIFDNQEEGQGPIGHITKWELHQRVDHANESKLKTYFRREPLATASRNGREDFATPSRNGRETSRAARETLAPEGEGEGDQGKGRGSNTPRGLTELQYATRLMEEIQMPHTQQNLRQVAAGIKSEEKAQGNLANAYDFVLMQARTELNKSGNIEGFWFGDKKWRKKTKTSTSVIPAVNMGLEKKRVALERLGK